MPISFAAAVVIWNGWVDLGRRTGFGPVQPLPGIIDGFWINTAIALPIGIDAYSAYALRVYLSAANLSTRTRKAARRSAIVSLIVGGAAQIASHLMAVNKMDIAPWWVTAVVSCVPVAVVWFATSLATLVRQDRSLAAAAPEPSTQDSWRRRKLRLWRKARQRRSDPS